MRARLADEQGFSLVELLAALVVGTIVLFAVFGLLDTAVRLQAKSVDSLDATDRGRVGIDQISQGLSSRICVAGEPSIVDGRDDRVEFFASLAPESSAVRLIAQRRRFMLTTLGVREEVWMSSPPTGPDQVPPSSATTPTTSRIVVGDVRPTAGTPMFRYYAKEGTASQPTQLLGTPLSDVDRSRVARIDVAFTAYGKRADVGTPFDNEIISRITSCAG